MKRLRIPSYAWLLACLLLTASLLARDPTKPGPMRQAIAHLEAARSAGEPLASLRAARRAVVNARPNKGGERKEAINAIDQAIQAAETGNKQVMNAKIAHAIYDLKQGMNNAK